MRHGIRQELHQTSVGIVFSKTISSALYVIPGLRSLKGIHMLFQETGPFSFTYLHFGAILSENWQFLTPSLPRRNSLWTANLILHLNILINVSRKAPSFVMYFIFL